MKEETPRSQLVQLGRELMKDFVFLRHEDKFKHGIPDLSVSGRGMTSWWEFKLAQPDFKSEGIQELTMKRLNAACYARYVIYVFEPVRCIRVVHPDKLAQWESEGLICISGWNHATVLKCIWEAHAARI